MKQQTKLPRLTWTSTSVISINSRPGSVYPHVATVLSDGKRRYFESELTIDTSVEGVGGVDSFPMATDSWYHIFLVPDPADDDRMDVIAEETTTPAAGPSGGGAFRYIGSAYANGSSEWREFQQVGTHFFFTNLSELSPIIEAVSRTVNTWYSMDLVTAKYVPEGAVGMASIAMGGRYAPIGERLGVVIMSGEDTAPSEITPAGISNAYSIAWSCAHGTPSAAGWSGHAWVPWLEGDSDLWYYSAGSFYNGDHYSMGLLGFTNKYLEE